jgi:hypothetical protein
LAASDDEIRPIDARAARTKTTTTTTSGAHLLPLVREPEPFRGVEHVLRTERPCDDDDVDDDDDGTR